MNKVYLNLAIIALLCSGCASRSELQCANMNFSNRNFTGNIIFLNTQEKSSEVFVGEIEINKKKYAATSYFNARANDKIRNLLDNSESYDSLVRAKINSSGIFRYNKRESKCFYEIENIYNIELLRRV